MQVTDITPQKSKNRFNIYIDDKFWFGISSDGLIKSGIFKDKEVKLEDMKEIVVDEIKNRIYTRSVRKIARRPHSTREVLNYCDRVLYKNLDDWLDQSFVKISSNVQDEIKQDIIQELKARDLLSDKKFAQWWVNSRKKYKPRSTYMIKGELMQKGISNKVINSLDLGREANIQMAQSLFDKKFNPEIADKDSVIKYLKNKKFNWDIIKYILKRNNLE